eukprot:CAMPEP_0171380444 /NCGR_PEP_ID=MMETSP0879-20121228/29248_1 /TAXON_ID=67004 /ORGANISM="Thalassiosira weissflogii, Strain CCMP1336" /LENGTH=69 /DNA_ID=CAMNT_0011891537 /DNA_START=236 /DNA_END=443 /DNA_ORIENTATION=-
MPMFAPNTMDFPVAPADFFVEAADTITETQLDDEMNGEYLGGVGLLMKILESVSISMDIIMAARAIDEG